MYKVAIFSDIHSNFQALEAIINDINKNKFDEVICLGDVLAIGPNPRECLDLIINNNIRMLFGNHELYFIEGIQVDDELSDRQKEHQRWVASNLDNKHREYLLKCNLEYNLKINNYLIGFKHFLINKDSTDGYPFHSLEILRDGLIKEIIKSEECDIIFFGHEHSELVIDGDSKKGYDVGSSGCTINNLTHYVILTINDNDYRIEKKEVTYDRSKFEQTMHNANYPDKNLIASTFFGL